jgi:cytochrome c oxidase cbb3-type subunit 2
MGGMNRTALIALGVALTVLSSFVGLVAIPQRQLEGLEPVTLDDGTERPVKPYGAVKKGRQVYIAMGCIYCHSQQVRREGFGADQARGWGTRQTVPRDHIYDRPPLLGTMRTGPDLSNIGARQPSEDWHYLHLYNPQLTSKGSVMPPFPFLFEEVSKVQRPDRPGDALNLPEEEKVPGHWVVPSKRAQDLVAYLKSLDHGYPVPELAGGRAR